MKSFQEKSYSLYSLPVATGGCALTKWGRESKKRHLQSPENKDSVWREANGIPRAQPGSTVSPNTLCPDENGGTWAPTRMIPGAGETEPWVQRTGGKSSWDILTLREWEKLDADSKKTEEMKIRQLLIPGQPVSYEKGNPVARRYFCLSS